jgi:hypothetical protein
MVYRKKGTVGEEVIRILDLLNQKAVSHGGSLLSTNASRVTEQFEFQCRLGHKFSLTGSSVLYKESWCSKCRNGRPTSASEVNAALKKEGLLLISPFEKISARSRFKCMKCEKTFESPVNKVIDGQRSCACKALERKQEGFKKKIDLLQEIVLANGGELVTTAVLQMRNKFTFRCAEGHEWDAQGGSVLYQGTWCPKCSGNFIRSLDEVRLVAESRGGKLVSNEYKGVDATYEFECNLGHEFSNMFKKIEGGQWCPTCSRGTKSEEITRTYFEEIFDSKFKKVRPKWLRNSRGRQMELDGYSSDLKIAFEYQGIQHFKEFGLYNTNLEQRIIDDERKLQLCQEHGISLFYLTFKDSYEDFPDLIKGQAKAFNLRFPDEIFEREVDLRKAYLRDDRLQELRELLAPKKINVLSTVWLTSNAKYSFECQICGHLWQAQGNAFFNSRSVSGCNVCARRKNADANRGSLETLRNFAAKFGGQVLSEEYVLRKYEYKWLCAKGHVFERNYNNMAFRQQFCPQCEGTVTRKRKQTN